MDEVKHYACLTLRPQSEEEKQEMLEKLQQVSKDYQPEIVATQIVSSGLEEALREIKEKCDNLCKNIQFETTDDTYNGLLRVPNQKEQIKYLKGRLWSLYCAYEMKGFTKNAYSSIKGQISHGYFDSFFNFCKKRGYHEILSEFEHYCNTKSIADIKCILQFPEEIKYCTMDIILVGKRNTEVNTDAQESC